MPGDSAYRAMRPATNVSATRTGVKCSGEADRIQIDQHAPRSLRFTIKMPLQSGAALLTQTARAILHHIARELRHALTPVCRARGEENRIHTQMSRPHSSTMSSECLNTIFLFPVGNAGDDIGAEHHIRPQRADAFKKAIASPRRCRRFHPLENRVVARPAATDADAASSGTRMQKHRADRRSASTDIDRGQAEAAAFPAHP